MSASAGPDLETDPRVTQTECKVKLRNTIDVLYTVIKQRLPKELGTVVIHSFIGKCSRWKSFENQKFGVCLQDYVLRLMADHHYRSIVELFRKYMDVFNYLGPHEEKRFKNLLMLCFLPVELESGVPHDDWIMMVFLMTSELANDILLSTGNAKDVVILMLWAEEVLKPRKDLAFNVGAWLFTRWLHNYRTLRDPTRECKLLHDAKIFETNEEELVAAIDKTLPPSAPRGAHLTFIPPSQLQTVLCPNIPPVEVFSLSCDGRDVPSEGAKVALGDGIIGEVLHSYVMSRMPKSVDTLVKSLYSSQRTFSVYTDFSNRLLGLTMKEYGDLIIRTDVYDAILQEVITRLPAQSTRLHYKDLIHEYIFPKFGTILYDRIVLIFLLTSELVNDRLMNEDTKMALEMFHGALDALRIHATVVEEGLFRMHMHRKDISIKEAFDLLHDHSLIHGPGELAMIRHINLPQLFDPYRPEQRPLAYLAKTSAEVNAAEKS